MLPYCSSMLIRDIPATNAIKVGRLFLKPASVNETITRCCRMVFHEAEDPTLPLGRSGTATLIQHERTNYVITTRHEIGIPPGVVPHRNILDTVRISSGIGRLTTIPLQLCIFETSNADEEFHDILIFQTPNEWSAQEADAPYFFQLEPYAQTERRASFMVGYPTHDGVMDEYLDNFSSDAVGHIHMKRQIADSQIDSGFKTNVRHFRRYTHNVSHVDGYSGSAVFSLAGQFDTFEMVLDGIILRVARNTFTL